MKHIELSSLGPPKAIMKKDLQGHFLFNNFY